jgi:hypothetical protein
MRRAIATAAALALASAVHAEVLVRISGGGVELTATAAPLGDVLDHLARQTGMKVVYEGPAPRQLVTLSVHGRSTSETILALLEGQGLNYAFVADATGTGIDTLLVAGPIGRAASTSSAPTPSPPTPPTLRRPFFRPPAVTPDSVDAPYEDSQDTDEPPFAGMPADADASDPALAPEGADPNAPAQPPDAGAQQPGPIPTVPAQEFPVSPFAPQPQPFPPLPPGAPVTPTTGEGGTSPQHPQTQNP